MAIFTSGITSPNGFGQGLDMFSYDVNSLFNYLNFSSSPTQFSFFDDANNSQTFTGIGLTYDPNTGEPTSGTITGFVVRDNGVIIAQVVGLSVSALSLAIFINAGDTFQFLSLMASGNDTITGTAFNDSLWFGNNAGADTMNAGAGYDYAYGGTGDDTINGQDDGDFLVGGLGDDTINGGTGGDDFDTLGYIDEGLYFGGTQGITVNLSGVTQGTVLNGRAIDAYGNTDTISNSEGVWATQFADTVYAAQLVDKNFEFNGFLGNDIFVGTATGRDQIVYKFDSQFAANYNQQFTATLAATGITVNFAADAVAGNGSSGTVVDSFGNTDTVSGVDTVQGTFFADTFNGGADNEEFIGLKGADIINGGGGFDSANYLNDRFDNGVEAGGLAGITVNFAGDTLANGISVGTVIDGFGNIDQLTNIELIAGTDFNDVMTGGADRVEFEGQQGDDNLIGGSANDELRGGEGTDILEGGGGDDNLRGDEGGNFNQGNDELYGQAGFDSFKGGAGNDYIDGGEDRDRVEYNLETTFTGDDATHGVIVNLSTTDWVGVSVAGIASTTVAAGTAIDTRNYVDTLVSIEDVQGTGYEDLLHGGSEDNSLEGFEGHDRIYGGLGNDDLRGDDGGAVAGNDQLFGEGGFDYFKGGAGNDLIDGGADRDRVDYNSETTFSGDDATLGVIVNLSSAQVVDLGGIINIAAGTAFDTRNFVDTLISIEDILGTGYQDYIVGNADRNNLQGLGGDDYLIGGAEGDDLQGGTGLDIIRGELDADYISGGAGNDQIYGGTGGDEFDTLSYRHDYLYEKDTLNFAASQGITVNLGTTVVSNLLPGNAIDAFGDFDFVFEIEHIEGTGFTDTVYAGVLVDQQFEFTGFAGNDTFVGTTTGKDRLNYHKDELFVQEVLAERNLTLTATGITVNFAADTVAGDGASGTVIDSFGGTDTVSGVDVVRATFFVDTFNGGADNEEFLGLKGADIINGGGGFDIAAYYNDQWDNGFQAGAGSVGITANFSGDTTQNGNAVGTVADAFGTIDQISNIEAINGTDFNDTLTGGADNIEFWANDGDDTAIVGSGDLYFDGNGAVNGDTIILNGAESDFTAFNATQQGGAGVYIFTAANGKTITARDVEFFVFTNATRTAAQLNFGPNLINGTANADTLNGTFAADEINGLNGNDTLNGLGGSDFLFGGEGDDTIYFDALDLNANVNGGNGTDTLRVVDGSLPTGFNLVASAFEKAEWLQTDTLGQSFATKTGRYDSAWQITSESIVFDAGTSRELLFDYTAPIVYKSQQYDYSTTGLLTYHYTIFDNDASRDTTYDNNTPGIVWQSQRNDYEASGFRTYIYFVFDDNASRDTTFDNNTPGIAWQSQRNDYDATGFRTYNYFVFDDSSSRDTTFDNTAPIVWKSQSNDYDAFNFKTLNTLIFDDNTSRYTSYDNTVGTVWKSLRQDYDATGALTYQFYVFDNDTSRQVVYDVANNQPWTTATTNYDAAGNVVEYFVV